MPWLSQVKGVVEAWYPGEQQGTALARLLYGDVNFIGQAADDVPEVARRHPRRTTPGTVPGLLVERDATTRVAGDSSIRQVSYSEGLAIGYKWYQSQGHPAAVPVRLRPVVHAASRTASCSSRPRC